METIVYSYKKWATSFLTTDSVPEKAKLLFALIIGFPLFFALWVFSNLLSIISKH